MNNLTPQLNIDQLKQNIDALKAGGKDNATIQAYVDNYQRDASGNYVLKNNQALTESSTLTKVKDATRGLVGSLLKPAEDVVRTAVAPVVAGGKSLVKGTDFGTEYEQTLENLKTAPSLSSIVSGGQVQATGRDLKDEKMQALGDVIQSVPLVKGVKLASGIAKTAQPILGKAGAAIAAGAIPGYMLDVGTSLSEGEDIGEAVVPGVGTAIGTAIPLAPYVIRGVGSIGKKTGEKIVEAVIPKSMQEAQILQAYKAGKTLPERIGDVLSATSKPPQGAYKTTVEKGLMGTKSMIGIQAKRASQKLWKDLIGPRLKATDAKVNLPKYFDTVKEKIILENDDLGRQKVLLEALDAIKDDYKNIENIDFIKLQKLKEGWAKFVPEKTYRGKPIAGAYNDVRNQLADEARQTIYATLGDDVKQAYLDYGNLLGLQEMGVVSMTGQKLKGGSFTGLAEIVSQAVTPIGTIAGRAIYKLSNGLEIVGKAGAKTLEEALELNPQVLSQPTKTQTSQTIKNQKNIVPNTSNIDNTIPQKTVSAIDDVEKSKMFISDEVYENAKKNFKENMGRINSGIPVDQIKDLTVMAAYHIERGVRSAAELAKVYAEAGYNFTKKELESLYNKAIKEKPTIVSGSKLPLNKIEELEQFKGFFDADTQKFSSREIKKDAIKFLVDNDIDIKSTKDADIVDHIDEILTRRESLRKVTAGEVKGVSKELQPLYNEAKKYKSAEEFARKDFQDKIIAAQDLGKEIGKRVNPDGTLTLYHGTSKQNADKIMREGIFNDGTYFSVKKTGTKYGDSPMDVARRKFGKDATIIEVKVDARGIESAAAGSEVFSPQKLFKQKDGSWSTFKK